MKRLTGLVIALGLAGCPGPTSPPDAATAPDAARDAGCTLVPGDLPGDRMVAAGALLPALTFTGATGEVALVDRHVPCAPEAELIVIRSLAAWSGHSRWHVAHTGALLAHPEHARFHVIDLLVENEDALPARVGDLAPFAALHDAMPDAVAIDPGETFGALAFGGSRLPAVAIVDARTLRLVRMLFAPRAGEIEHAIDVALASLDGLPPPDPYDPPLMDARFSADEWDLVLGMRAAGTPPADPSNAHADDPAAATLGAVFFADTGMSPAGVACASCHDATHGYSDALAVGHGVADVTRNTPTLFAASFARWPFWDGRVDSLWAQALGPSESAREMGSSRLFIAHRIASMHRTAYEAVFGAMPDVSALPAAGAPGDAAYDATSAADQTTVTRIFTNFGKAIEAYERTIATPHTRFDDYLSGSTTALTDAERDGLREFVREGCADCHWGPAMSDSAFHAIGMPGVGEGSTLDVGRSAVLATLAGSPFRRTGAFSDDAAAADPLAGVTELDPSTVGAFRTPTLRGLSTTAPYGHAGTFATLHDVVDHYARVRMPHPADPHVAGGLDEHLVGFDPIPGRIDPIVAFLETL